jgi:lysozyme family protein
MKDNFSSSFELLLKHEGGYVNHPDDPGGRTNHGITQRVYEKFLGEDVTEEEMKDMPLEDVFSIYKDDYWDRIRGDELPSGVDLCVFDWAVNSGVSQASKALQRVLGVLDDGIIGSRTVAAACRQENQAVVVEAISQKREDFYRSLGTFDTFGRGWLRRNDETLEKALQMLEEEV